MKNNFVFKTVGLFGLVFLLVVLLLFLYEYFNYKTYAVVFDSKSISGLSAKAPVEFNGVVVGKIRKITFDKHNPKNISALLHVSANTPITKGTRVSLSKSSFILLSDDGLMPSPLTLKQGEAYPFIITSEVNSSKSNEQETRDENLKKIANALDKFNEMVASLLTKENVENLSQIMYSLQQVSGVFSANSQRLDTIIVKTEEASHDISPFVHKANKTMDTINTQTLPRVYQLLYNLEGLLSIFKEVAKTVEQNPTVFIRGKSSPRLGPGEKLTYTQSSRQR